MIKIVLKNIVFNNEVDLTKRDCFCLEFSGHSFYDKKGNDIVCSAISALTQTFILTVSRILKIEQKIIRQDGFLNTLILKKDVAPEKLPGLILLIESFLVGIVEINREYPERIKIEIVND